MLWRRPSTLGWDPWAPPAPGPPASPMRGPSLAQVLHAGLGSLGPVRILPYLTMFAASNAGGWAGDWLINVRRRSVASGRKLVNTAGWVGAWVGGGGVVERARRGKGGVTGAGGACCAGGWGQRSSCTASWSAQQRGGVPCWPYALTLVAHAASLCPRVFVPIHPVPPPPL